VSQVFKPPAGRLPAARVASKRRRRFAIGHSLADKRRSRTRPQKCGALRPRRWPNTR